MPPCQPAARRGAAFWLLLIGATVFLSLEPGLFLVVLAVSLAALALTWTVLLARLLLLDALSAHHTRTLPRSASSQDPAGR